MSQKDRKEWRLWLRHYCIICRLKMAWWREERKKKMTSASRDDPKAHIWVSSRTGRGKSSLVQAGQASTFKKERFCWQHLKITKARTSLPLLGEHRSGIWAFWTSSSNINSSATPTGLGISISNLESDLSRVDSGIQWESKPGCSLKVWTMQGGQTKCQ